MPRTENIEVPNGQWTELTSGTTTNISFMVTEGIGRVYFTATASATPPTVEPKRGGTFWFKEGFGLTNEDPAALFPGITGANRIWAWPENSAVVFVSHA